MKPQKTIVQLSLFDEGKIASASRPSPLTPKDGVVKASEKEVKVVSFVDYQYKKAEEKFNSYADHLI